MLVVEEYKGQLLTAAEILLAKLYEAVPEKYVSAAVESSKSGLADSSEQTGSVVMTTSCASPKESVVVAMGANKKKESLVTTPPPSDRRRVQQFLLKRQASNSSFLARKNSTGSSSQQLPTGGEKVKPMLNKAKSPLVKQKRSNPLNDILKGGSGSILGHTNTANSITGIGGAPKRSRIRPERPGEMFLGDGKASILLPPESYLHNEDWDSHAYRSPLQIVLPSMSYQLNNTLIIRATIPPSSQHCCFNICSQHDQKSETDTIPSDTIIYQFNPRRVKGGQVFQNSRIDNQWGEVQVLQVFARNCPMMFGRPFVVRITFTREGLLVFLEELFQYEFKYRNHVVEGENLVLKVPTTDQFDEPEGVVVHNVWWGHADISRNSLAQPMDMHNTYNNHHSHMNSMNANNNNNNNNNNNMRYDVYVGNLPQEVSKHDIMTLFGYLQYDHIRLTSKGFAFVSFRTVEDMEKAVRDLDNSTLKGNRIKVSIARPSRR